MAPPTTDTKSDMEIRGREKEKKKMIIKSTRLV